MIPNPFNIQDHIRDQRIHSTPRKLWIENVAPADGEGIAFLKPALRIWRLRLAFCGCLILLGLLLFRGIQLQLINFTKYRQVAESNRLRIIRIRAPRGTITDRNGIPLTKNVPRFEIVLNPLDLPRDAKVRREMLDHLTVVSETPREVLEEQLRIIRLPVRSLVIKANVELAEVYPFLISTQAIPGISIATVASRQYPAGAEFSPLLGYMGKIEESEKNTYLEQNYGLDDLVGKSGLEEVLEKPLRGKDGRKHAEVNSRGQIQNVDAQEDAQPGGAVALTIDAPFQQAIAKITNSFFEQFHKHSGAVIVLNPKNGELLAMLSLPTFDNNLLNPGPTRGAAYAQLLNDQNDPLFPRALSGLYPSGSTIKPVVAAAALQEKIISPNTTVLSTGGLRVGQWFFPDWKGGGHGLTNVTKALAESVNTFFYMLGGGYDKFNGLGIERLAKYLRAFGFGSPTGIEISGEGSGLVPDPEWKRARQSAPWYIGDTYHLAIGQGDFLVTPLQIARVMAYFASGGVWTTPHLIMDPANHENFKGLADGPNIDTSYIQTIRQGLRQTVLAGSARSLQALPIASAGKTGTAQWSSIKSPHAWFSGFAPYEDPQIAVTVMVEEGGEGSAVAAPIAREIIKWWYENRMKNVQ